MKLSQSEMALYHHGGLMITSAIFTRQTMGFILLTVLILTSCGQNRDEIDYSGVSGQYENIYMGGAANVKTGPKGEVANAALIDHSSDFEKKVYQLSDKVYCLVGISFPNLTVIDAPKGLVLIDTADTVETARLQWETFSRAYPKVAQKPVKAIIYSHFHYALGTRYYVDKFPDVEIWGSERLAINIINSISDTGIAFMQRLSRHMGLHLPEKGPDAMPNLGIGSYFIDLDSTHTLGFVFPDRLVKGSQTAQIAGLEFSFSHYCADTNDSLIVWVPELKLAVNNHFWSIFPNMSTLRGGPFRNPGSWISGIDYMRDLEPEILVSVHGQPYKGRDSISEILTACRDAMQFVYDQTVRGINKGFSPDQLVEFVKLPPHLADNPYLQDYYGELSTQVRGLYSGLVGWFGTDTATIQPVPAKIEAEKIIQGFGGREAVRLATRQALEKKEWAWAAKLATHLILTDKKDKEARQFKADALRQMARVTPAATTRSWMLTQALELEDKIDASQPVVSFLTSFTVRNAPPHTFVNFLRFTLDPVKAAEEDTVFGIYFTDIKKGYGLHVYQGVARFLDEYPENADVAISLTHELWAGIVAKEKNMLIALASKKVKITQGNLFDFKKFFSMFETS